MKMISMVLALMAALVWSTSRVSACDGCGCKGKVGAAKADTTAAMTTTAATETAVKCVACPLAQSADATKPAAKCTGDCKVGCCKGDPAKCAACKAGTDGKTCPAQTAGATTTTCAAAKTCCGAAGKSCGYALPTAPATTEAPVKDAK